MASYKLTTVQEVEDFIRGLALLGTGGGGRPETGRALLLEHVESGTALGWTGLGDIPDDTWTCGAFGMGSIAPRPADFVEKEVGPEYGQERVPYPLVNAIKELEEYAGVKVGAIVPFELGAFNTPAPLDAAVRLGIPLVDGDAAGRAIPEVAQALPALHGRGFCPAAIADTWGNVLIVKQVSSTAVAETLGKMISVVTKGPDIHAVCGFAAFLNRAGEVKDLLVPNSLTQTLFVGRAIREARERGQDPVQAAAEAVGGWLLFKGEVSGKEWESREGYMYGTTTIRGCGQFAGQTFKIWFKNENHVTWKDDRVFVTSPDLIMVAALESGEPIINTYLQAGDRVAVLGKAGEAYRTELGLRALGPRHFGFELEYVPLEQLVS